VLLTPKLKVILNTACKQIPLNKLNNAANNTIIIMYVNSAAIVSYSMTFIIVYLPLKCLYSSKLRHC